ncbi:hypothetical protein UY3_02364 [Chelonia mydas]|uniref:Uncharacterized protein n=1 Tax=Chelonia mydas TaxID=8469 RepID=M7C775_CHEMY|nr:hypothetical protein UY3_02364 [Chelonia mydas]
MSGFICKELFTALSNCCNIPAAATILFLFALLALTETKENRKVNNVRNERNADQCRRLLDLLHEGIRCTQSKHRSIKPGIQPPAMDSPVPNTSEEGSPPAPQCIRPVVRYCPRALAAIVVFAPANDPSCLKRPAGLPLF